MTNVLPQAQLRELFAKWVREGRDRYYAGNRSKMAKDTGVSRETIWKIERCRTDADEETVRKLAEKIGSPPVLRETQQERPTTAQAEIGAPERSSAVTGAPVASALVRESPGGGWNEVAESVARKWQKIIVDRKIPHFALLELLRAEERWLRKRELYAAADDVKALIKSISTLDPR